MNEPTAIFYGWEVVEYVHYLIKAYISQFPWQVQLSFGLIATSTVTILFLFILFSRRAVARTRADRAYQQCCRRYESRIRMILSRMDKLSQEEIEYLCEADSSQIQETDPAALTRLILSIRMELSNMVYVPNMQRICRITGVQTYLENNLIKHNDVERTLQILSTLPLRVDEGALAAYTENKDPRIRELARAYYGFCSKTEPFAMVTRDVNKPFHLWYPTTFHRLCGWHVAKGHPLPHFSSLISQSTNEEKKALFISEIPYWGTQDEKRSLRQFLKSPSRACCSAAIQALAQIGDTEAEADLIRDYDYLFPKAKRETLRAVARMNTGKQVEFFRKSYLHSTSHNTRAVALTCLFNYGPEGRRVFNELANAGLDDYRFFEQIKSTEGRTE